MPGKQILVVDDETAVRELTTALLQRLGYFPLSAANGGEALQKLETIAVDLVITDLDMPGMKGDILASQIRQRWPTIPIILITGTVFDHLPPQFDAVLNKPFYLTDLRTVLHNALGTGE